MKVKDIERISKALSDPNRLKILQEVKRHNWMQCSDICEIINLAQPSISHHIKQLTDSELLISEKEGRNIKYTINQEVVTEYIDFLNSLKS
ncbi:helix-turn-helix transcriptional regulator [Flavobacterium salilacus subsp. salilacus]|uniref:ArsR/SmtB family transcription factor n=1 Tax=Flavobacterium TaxID=237 RepID=UPI00107518DA|nr:MULTISPECIES: metalloregulator ArsR/SmtB family transcription factor [Flavobacterium]KAF2516882.1 helix-turn-helix transcriptional regulator [Flavobacterium salilacus subsp. salilacus]MBE1615758.1 helix-turn-helix transcriptional regulator [Flavobacterium sp. SaA2.13]